VSEQQARRRKPVSGISEEFHAPPRLLPFVSGNDVVIPNEAKRNEESRTYCISITYKIIFR